MHQTKIFFNEDVPNKLKEMGLSLHNLRKAIETGFLEGDSCTKYDSPMMKGLNQWNAPMRSLKEDLVPKGWIPSNKKGMSRVISPSGKFEIIVSSGNAKTGIINATPSNKNDKGPYVCAKVYGNEKQLQFSFMESFKKDEDKFHKNNSRLTWFLLFFVDIQKGEIRFELSLPDTINERGFITYWNERIILPTLPIEDITVTIIDDNEPDIDIDIRKRG